jgi:alpha-tubulin suppressor-like RCC1 family protein
MSTALPFVKLGTGRKAIDIKANGSFTCALLDDHSLKCWGANDSGQLGQGDTTNRGTTPLTMGDGLKAIDFGKGRTVVDFAVGFDHACAVLDNNNLKCWGANNGELGQGDTNARGDKPNEMGDNLKPVFLGLGRSAVQVSCGYSHTCVLLDNSSVKCFGANDSGQLGLGDTNARGIAPTDMGDNLKAVDLGTTLKPIRVYAASTHSCAFFEDHSIKCWGDGNNGALGTEDTTNHGDGNGAMGAALPFISLEPGLVVDQFSCARRHCCALFAGPGTMKCWGQNDNGQLGLGDQMDRGSQTGQMGSNLPFTDLGNFEAATQIATGRYNTCAILADGGVKCWGVNSSGQLGLGDGQDRGGVPGQMGDQLPRTPIL